MPSLNDLNLRNLKLPVKGQKFHWDDRISGFGIRASQGGAKTFVLKHRNRFITIGRFPILSLSDARAEAKRLLAEFTLGRVRPQALPYPTAVKLFLEEKGKNRRQRTVGDYTRLLNRLPFKGQLSEITHDEVARQLKKFPSEGEYNHILVALRVFFNWCVKRRYIEHNPTVGLSQHNTQSRSRVLTDEELGRIWRACEQPGDRTVWQGVQRQRGLRDVPECLDQRDVHKIPASPRLPANFARIVQLLMLTGQRRGEIAALQSSWIKSNGSSPHTERFDKADSPSPNHSSQQVSITSDLWLLTIPAEVTKNGREHSFPIGTFCANILSTVLSDSQSGLLFSARGKIDTAFSGWSKSKAALDKLCGVKDWTLHDLRRTYATNMARLGVPVHIVEKLLNHVSGTHGGIVGVYQRHQYWNEQVEAVEKYQKWLASTVVID